MPRRKRRIAVPATLAGGYDGLLGGIAQLLDQSRRAAARTINGILTATYWEIGRRIVEFEQGGRPRAEYGEGVLNRLAADLTARFGRGFSERNLLKMRTFHLDREISPTLSAEFTARARVSELGGDSTPIRSGKSVQKPPTPSAVSEIRPTMSAEFGPALIAAFPLSWSQYVRLMSVPSPAARAFYEAEAIRGGWSVRQLDRQISTQFFERTTHSKQPTGMLARAHIPKPEDVISAQDEVRSPYILEFLDLRDEYSESELEASLIRHLESFLLELGAGFTFVARQKRIRVGDEWYRIDLLLFHRRLKCLVVIDLKIGKFTHADAGQMNLYLNYVREHLSEPNENEPVGLILCSEKNDAVVHYAMGGIQAKVFASRYLTVLPDADTLRREIQETKRAFETKAVRADE